MSVVIEETKNDLYKIEAVRMSNDAPIPQVHAPLPQNYNFFMIVCGQPGSGKTCWMMNMINKKSKHTLYKKFDRVLLFSNSLHTIGEKIKLPPDRMFDGISELEEEVEGLKCENHRALIILDDVISDIKSNDFFMKLLYNRRHIGGGVSIIIMTQVWNKLSLGLRKVATQLVFFNTSNKKEFQSIYDDFINIKRETFDEIIKYIFDDKHHFMFLDCIDKIFYKNFNLLTFAE